MGAEVIIDCFQFFNELDLLEIRLNSLAPRVDRFVLVESPLTHTGKPKPLYFDDNKDRFRDFNIVHLVYENASETSAPGRYWNQIDFLMNGLADADPDDTILLSDVDEIPNLRKYKEGTEGVFRQRLFYYYLNVYTAHVWHGTVAIKKKNIRQLRKVRKYRGKFRDIGNGWHFSYVCPTEDIIYKIESFGHSELNTPKIKEKIAENRNNLTDPFNRYPGKYAVRMPSGPAWLLKNKDKYEHLFYKEQNAHTPNQRT